MTQAEPGSNMDDATLVQELAAIVGADHVRTEGGTRQFFATDIFTSGVPVDAVVAPADADQLARIVRLCAAADRPLVPRGGGFSYTKGYVPVRPGSVSVDLRRMDAIVEINEQDLYVVVEAGCTWRSLYETLKAKGLRTPYFGPMSGYHATVGGALSQGSFFLGSTQYGTTSDTVLGLEAVLADGTVVRTGSGGGTNGGSPFFRPYGPDLTGLFLHDSGALGFKTRAVLKLIPFPAHHRYATFAFEAHEGDKALAAMAGIAHAGLAAECYLWDPGFAAKMAVNNSLVDDLRYFTNVLKTGKGVFGGLKDGLRLAATGKKFLAGNRYLLHATFDDVSDAGVQGRLDEAFRIAGAQGGQPIEPSIPRALRAMPFNDFTALAFADQSQRNLPTHGIMPHSRIAGAAAAVQAYFADNAARLAAQDVTIGTIYFAVGANAICCEPLFYWTDHQLAAHDRAAERSDLDALATMPDRPPAGRLVAEMRAELVALFTSHGAVHCQIGKSYPYRETRRPETFALLQAIKAAIDPAGLLNPGALGL
ncbi:FAD-binding oxidoreductase [Novosphingobium sp. BL-52-GroH]|uniref:FAD-binding oxidoreductase n=1 Tax=Novosphingobium sp. BL-52-GroH TaxID=3349877 RepID=UPI0038507901